jgi:hypothetical protein
MPKGITIDEDSIVSYPFSWYKDKRMGEQIHPDRVYIKESIGEYNVWVIEYKLDEYIGFYSEELNDIVTRGESIEFEMDLVTDVTMPSVNMYINEMFIMSSAKNNTDTSDSYLIFDDYWDLNDNGDYEDCVVGVNGNNDICISIIGEGTMVRASDSISVTGTGSVTDKTATLGESSDIVTYTVDINRIEVGTLQAFEQYIVIPKKDMDEDGFLITNDKEERFDFILS